MIIDTTDPVKVARLLVLVGYDRDAVIDTVMTRCDCKRNTAEMIVDVTLARQEKAHAQREEYDQAIREEHEL